MPSLTSPHPSFAELLTPAPRRLIEAALRLHALPFTTTTPRPTQINQLRVYLSAITTLTSLTATLPPSARELLVTICTTNGQITAHALTTIGGLLRPLSYQQIADAPWQYPQTPSEHLVYRGLLLPIPQSTPATYTIPAELLTPLRAIFASSLPPVQPADQPLPPIILHALPTTECLRHDLLILLLTLHQEPRPVQSGTRLPIATVRHLGSRLAHPQDYTTIHTHREATHLWFLTRLAQSANLLLAPRDGTWTLTYTALRWITLTPDAQLHHLWYHWHPTADLHLPLPNWPDEWHPLWDLAPNFTAHLRTWLAALPLDQWVDRAAWERHPLPPLLQPSPFGRLTPLTQRAFPHAQTTLLDHLLPPLTALGLLDHHPQTNTLRLTPHGHTWARTIPHPPPPHPHPLPWQRHDTTLHTPWPADPTALWRLAPFARLLSSGTTLTWELTPATVAQGLAHSLPLTTLQRALSVGGLPLTADLLPYPAPRLLTHPILETATPDQMHHLRAHPPVRRALAGGRFLTPRHHTLLPSRLPALQTALTALGQPPQWDTPQPTRPDTPQRRPTPNGLLFLAARLWQETITALETTRHHTPADLPPYLPHTLLQDLEQTLTPADRDAATTLWQTLLPRLQHLTQPPQTTRSTPNDWPFNTPSPDETSLGETPASQTQAPPVGHPTSDTAAPTWLRHLTPDTQHSTPDTGIPDREASPWDTTTPTLETLLATIRAAINTNTPLYIRYDAPDKLPTHRLIEPHALEQDGPHWYLTAHCHTADAPRTFRLDRLRILPSEKSKVESGK